MTRDNAKFDYTPTEGNLSDVHRAFISESRSTIQSILTGDDARLLLLVGPCSVHCMEATLEYGEKLAALAESVSDRIFCVMRAYVEKPRTTLGWKGMLYDPHLDGSYELEVGIAKTQQLLSSLVKLRLPLGAEVLELTTAPLYTDYLSWGCIGARTSASPPHRQTASGLPFPIGFKNSIDGNIDIAVHGIIAAKEPHIYLGPSASGQIERIQTKGNPACHIILRGSQQRPNYSADDVARSVLKAQKAGVPDRVVIDCSHDNSFKEHAQQPIVFDAVIEQIESGQTQIAGLMLESFLEEGAQPLSRDLQYGVSITDSCLSWEMTERLITDAYRRLSPTQVSFCYESCASSLALRE